MVHIFKLHSPIGGSFSHFSLMEKASGMKFPLTADSFQPDTVGLINEVGALRTEYRSETDSDVQKKAHHQIEPDALALSICAGELKRLQSCVLEVCFFLLAVFTSGLLTHIWPLFFCGATQRNCRGADQFGLDIHSTPAWRPQAPFLTRVRKGQGLFLGRSFGGGQECLESIKQHWLFVEL